MAEAEVLTPVDEGVPEGGGPRVADGLAAMTPNFGWLASLFARRFFAGFRFPSAEAEQLHASPEPEEEPTS